MKPDTRKPLGEVKKALTSDDCSFTRAILNIYREIAAQHPQAIIDAFNARGSYISTLDADRQRGMIKFYDDHAAYMIDLLDHK